MNIIAVNLVALGVVVLACSGMFFSGLGQLADFPGIQFETAESHVILLVVGALMAVGGIALLIVNPKKAA